MTDNACIYIQRDTEHRTNNLCVKVIHTEPRILDLPHTYIVRNGDLCLKHGMLVLKTGCETVYISA